MPVNVRRLILALAATAILVAPASAQAGSKSITGRWRGTITLVKGGPNSFPIAMNIKRLKVGKRAGRLSNPGSPCHGKLVLRSRKGSRFHFRYHETSHTGKCTGNDRITMRRAGPKLRWRGVSPDGSVVGKGRLHHP